MNKLIKHLSKIIFLKQNHFSANEISIKLLELDPSLSKIQSNLKFYINNIYNKYKNRKIYLNHNSLTLLHIPHHIINQMSIIPIGTFSICLSSNIVDSEYSKYIVTKENFFHITSKNILDIFTAKRLLDMYEIDDALLIKKAKTDILESEFNFYYNEFKNELLNFDLLYPQKYRDMVKSLSNLYISKDLKWQIY